MQVWEIRHQSKILTDYISTKVQIIKTAVQERRTVNNKTDWKKVKYPCMYWINISLNRPWRCV